MPVERRAGFLDAACGDDAELREEAEGLLAEDARQTGNAVDRALADDAVFTPAPSTRPTQIGRYRILGICGSGGMGTVYEAEQDSPQRRVALKVLQSETPLPDLLSRFRREAEILARLHHPCIAQIFDAGEFDHDGVSRPYLAMEFVDGSPLLSFAARHRLDVRARIEIFLRICDAIQYAHSQGIVHRDLKPDNIFVVESSSGSAATTSPIGQPKVLDFGVARFADADRKMTIATGAGQLLGSVPYMSPEQAVGSERVGTLSDLYSLGVVLFELLTGRLPYSVRNRPLADALYAIRYDEPSRLGNVVPQLRGDLETIVGKTIEKDPDRRYPTVSALAEDLRHYQQNKPIAARAPSTWYQLRKFTQRNRALVGGTVATILAIVTGAVFALMFALRANDNQLRSEREAYRANIGSASALLESDPAHAARVLDGVAEAQRGWEWAYLSSAQSALLLEFGSVVGPRRREEVGDFHSASKPDFALLAERGQVIAPVSAHEFCVWDVWTGTVARTLTAPAAIQRFDASHDGSLLAAALDDGRVVVTDLRSDEARWQTWIEGRGEAITGIRVERRGRCLAFEAAGRLHFGRPGAWHEVDVGPRTFHTPPLFDFSPDGTHLGALAGPMRFFEVASGQPVGPTIESDQGHWAIAFAPDGKRVAAGQYRREIRLFDPQTGDYDVELLGHNVSVTGVAFSDDGSRLVSRSLDETIRVWDLQRAEQIGVFDAPGTTAVDFVDANHILSLTGGRLRLWTLDARRCRELVGHSGHIYNVVFSGSGRLLASTAPWADICVWDPLRARPLRTAPAERRHVIAFDREGSHLLTAWFHWAGNYVTGAPWLVEGAAQAWKPTRFGIEMAARNESVLVVDGADLAFKASGLIAMRTVHGPNTRVFCDGMHIEPNRTIPAPDLGPYPSLRIGGMHPYQFGGAVVELLVFDGALSERSSADLDTYLAERRAGGTGVLPDLSNEGARLFAHFRASADTIACDEERRVSRWQACNDPTLALIAHGSTRHAIRLAQATADLPPHVQFNSGYGTMRWLEMPAPQLAGKRELTVLWLGSFSPAHRGTAYGIATLSLPYAGSDRDERIEKPSNVLAFSRDHRFVADSGSDETPGRVRLRDANSGYCIAEFQGRYRGIAFHPDSQRIACGTEDGGISIFEVPSGRPLGHIESAHHSACLDVAFSPDGSRLASAGNDNRLRLWDAETLEPLLEFPGHRSYVHSVAWSPDGTMLASGSGDRVVRVWDSVPRERRYRQWLETRELDVEVSAEVRAWHADDPEGVLPRIRERWGADDRRRLAAFRVLAGLR